MLSLSVMSNYLQPHGLWPTRLLCPWDSPGKNTAVGCHALLQGILPTQGSNPGVPHCRRILTVWATRKVHFLTLVKWILCISYLLYKIYKLYVLPLCTPGGSLVKNPPASAGDLGLIPGSGRSPGGGNGNPLQCSWWKIPWTEGPSGLQSMGSQRVRHDWATKQQTNIH